MGDFFSRIYSALSGGIFGTSINVFDIIDVVIITVIIYQVLKFFKNTKAIHVLKGLAILVVALALASWIGLPTTTWLLSSLFTSGILIIAVILQPELRRALENLGRNSIDHSVVPQEKLPIRSNIFSLMLETPLRQNIGWD